MKLSRQIAVACVYADPSGLEDDDLQIYNTIGDFIVTDWYEDGSNDINGVCNFTGLWDRVVEIELRSEE